MIDCGHLRAVSATNARELLRDRTTLFFVLIFPFMFLALFWFIGLSQSGGKPEVAIAQQPPGSPAADVVASIRGALVQGDTVTVTSVTDEEAALSFDSGQAQVVLWASPDATDLRLTARSPSSAAAATVIAAAREAAPGADLRVEARKPRSEPFRFGVPGVLIMALASLGLFGTAAPLIKLRERGTLRLLRTTPLRPMTFLLGQVPARLVVALLQTVAIALLAIALGYTTVSMLPAVVVSCGLAVLLFFALGFFLGGIVRRSETFSGVSGGLLPIVLMISGVLIPASALPRQVARVASVSPLTYLGDVIRHDLISTPLEHSRAISYVVVAAVTGALLALASVTFSWRESGR